MSHYCFQCGTQLELQLRDNREREVCRACDWVYYAQLKVGAAVLIEQDTSGRIMSIIITHLLQNAKDINDTTTDYRLDPLPAQHV